MYTLLKCFFCVLYLKVFENEDHYIYDYILSIHLIMDY